MLIKVSFCWPQEWLVRDLRILSERLALSIVKLICSLKVYFLSKVRPSIFGLCTCGIGVLLICRLIL